MRSTEFEYHHHRFSTPGYFRPNVVRTFDPWYAAFGVGDGKLYLPPEQRIRIW